MSSYSFLIRLGGFVLAFDQTWEPWSWSFEELQPFRTRGAPKPQLMISLADSSSDGFVSLPRVKHLMLRVDEQLSPAKVNFLVDRPIPPVVALKIACSLMVPRWGGLFLHAALLSRNDQGILLSGPSGSGKSSLTGLWLEQGGSCGSDEAVLVFPSSRGWEGFPTPFWGALPPQFPARPKSSLLRAHLFLARAGFPQIMKCVFEGDRVANWASMHNLAGFLKALPPVRLPKECDILKRLKRIENFLPCCD